MAGRSLALILCFNTIPPLYSVAQRRFERRCGVDPLRLGAQTTLSNLVSGFALLFYQSFGVGEGVQLAASTGLETDVIDE